MNINNNGKVTTTSTTKAFSTNKSSDNINRRRSWIVNAINNSTATGSSKTSSPYPSTSSIAASHDSDYLSSSPLLDQTKRHQKQQQPQRNINEASEQLLKSLLQQWLTGIQLPVHPWSGILLNLVLQQVATHVDASSVRYKSTDTLITAANNKNHEDTVTLPQSFIWVQCMSTGKPDHSHFVPHVYRGVPLSKLLSSISVLLFAIKNRIKIILKMTRGGTKKKKIIKRL